ncbi:EfeM/EfeO family lipoprotein [Snodgrassella sp. CFCC 13594]|uniref:EfeM/EfeO family lipoprotein n=1 Tax=Snodgrassella sp. CFCC 13594 TaxID=1775559 RepID=UPI000834C2ED|nr:EfeM/EfeO family lipoprotein [Snodgrassella sp. CFCC 13594]
MNRSTTYLGVLLACVLMSPVYSSAHGLRAPIINDANFVAAKGDIPTPTKYQPAIRAYLQEVQQQLKNLDDLVGDVVRYSKAGHLQAAQQAYVKAHQTYERIRPIVVLFGNADRTINSRADYYIDGVNDPRFVGFHLVEYDLFTLKDAQKAHDDAVPLQYEVGDLRKRMAVETIEIAKMVQSSADFMEMILQTKLLGQENQFSHSDIADMEANVVGSQMIIRHLRPFIAQAQLQPIEESFAQIQTILQKYRLSDQQYRPFDQLSMADHNKLYSLVTEQADRLAQLRADLNVDIYYKYRR